MSSTEFLEWSVFYSMEPFGDERGDLQAGIIASTVANANRGKNSKPYSPKDFIPKFRDTPEKMSNSEMIQNFKRLTSVIK